MNILIVAAHPSDEVLGMGGTIYKYAQNNDNVYLFFFCKGPSEKWNDDSDKTINNYAIESAEILGVKDIYFSEFSFMEMNVQPMIKLVKRLESVIEKIHPEIVYTHHRGDVNTDHKFAFDATIAATRAFGEFIIKRVLCYEVPSSTKWAPPFIEFAFFPNVFEDVTYSFDKKIEALYAYKDEVRDFPHPRSPESLKLNAQSWGIKVGHKLVEAFELVRMI